MPRQPTRLRAAALLLGPALVAACSAPGQTTPPGTTAPVASTQPGPVTSGPPAATAATSVTSTPRSSSPPETGRPTPPAAPSASAGPTSLAPSGSPATGAPTDARSLPRGGTTIFPTYRLVGYCGAPGAPALGRLGVGSLADRAAEIEPLGAAYTTDGRRPMPVLELIATVVTASPGPDGLHRFRQPATTVDRYLAAARDARGLLLLNIQPGRADFLDEVKAYERWLVQPDVGVALDPEWAIGPGQIPGRVYGRTSGAELDAVAAYLSALVAEHGLPEKVMVYHQLHPRIVDHPEQLRRHPGVVPIVSVDGIGTASQKTDTWRQVLAETPPHVYRGFKLFYEEDRRAGPLMTPAQVLALTPRPEYVLYE